jgi:hypothetical protein
MRLFKRCNTYITALKSCGFAVYTVVLNSLKTTNHRKTTGKPQLFTDMVLRIKTTKPRSFAKKIVSILYTVVYRCFVVCGLARRLTDWLEDGLSDACFPRVLLWRKPGIIAGAAGLLKVALAFAADPGQASRKLKTAVFSGRQTEVSRSCPSATSGVHVLRTVLACGRESVCWFFYRGPALICSQGRIMLKE